MPSVSINRQQTESVHVVLRYQPRGEKNSRVKGKSVKGKGMHKCFTIYDMDLDAVFRMIVAAVEREATNAK
jgi:hypothetical protein